jgi:hypothetical protein
VKAKSTWGQLTAADASPSTVRIVSRFLLWYRIEAIEQTRLNSYRRSLRPGQRALVPTWTIRSVRAAASGSRRKHKASWWPPRLIYRGQDPCNSK